MPFDVEKMLALCESKIKEFARQHAGERFYAFAIDASMLCFNSIERFEESLREYQVRWDRQTRVIESMSELTEEDQRDEKFGLDLAEKYQGLDRSDERACLKIINEKRESRRSEGCKYRTEDGIRSLRDNTGDWTYQGFADLDDGPGFDDELYQDHYDEAMGSDDGHAPHTEYAIAMTELVARLQRSDAFKTLKLTEDFSVSWVDHSY